MKKIIFKYHFLPVLFFCLVGFAGKTQNVSIAQNVNIEEGRLNITFPGSNWMGGLQDISTLGVPGVSQLKDAIVYFYMRMNESGISGKSKTGDSEPGSYPSVTIFIDTKPVTKTAAGYAAEKNRLKSYTVIKTYTAQNAASPVPNLPQVVVHKVIQQIPMPLLLGTQSTTKGYVAYIVNQKKGISLTMFVKEAEFDIYEKEFVSILRSIISTAAAVPEALTVNQPVAKTINVCEYMPLGSRMSYTYLKTGGESGALAELSALLGGGDLRNFTEEYTFTKNKTVAGKQFKGYLLKTNDQTKNGHTFYFNCSNNDAKIHTEIYEWEKELEGQITQNGIPIQDIYNDVFVATGKYATVTQLKGSIPVGEIWTETEFVNGVEAKISTSIEETSLTLEVNEETYKDVIKVVKTILAGAGSVSMREEIYYAKGIGRIKALTTVYTALGESVSTYELVSYSIE